MIPIICIYLTVTMSLTSMSIILTVLVLSLHHHGHHAPPVVPLKLYMFMTSKVAHLVGMKTTVERYESIRNKGDKMSCRNGLIHPKKQHHTFKNADSLVMNSNVNEMSTYHKNSDSPILPHHTYRAKSSSTIISDSKLKHDLNKIDFKTLNDSLSLFNKNLSAYQSKQKFIHLNKSLSNQWKLVALILDRVLFWTFTTLTFVSSIILLVIVPVVKNKITDNLI